MISVVWILFAQGEKVRIEEGFYSQAERLADQILRSQREGFLHSWEDLPPEVSGFGLYNGLGLPTVLLGQIPSVFPPSEGVRGQGRVSYLGNGEFRFVKSLGFPLLRLNPLLSGVPHLPMGFLYLRFIEKGLSARIMVWNLLTFAVPSTAVGLLFVLGFLMVKNRRFEEEIRRNQELVKFAEAARTLSHELKNPVAAILLQANLLKRRSPESTEASVIEEEALRISHLAEKVRDFLKDPIGHPEKLRLNEFIVELLKRFPQEIPLHMENADSWQISMDPNRLRSVLENLIQNALESGPDPQVEIRIGRHKSRILVRVLDRGSGIGEADKEKVFQPFFTTKRNGSGIGLPIAKIFARAQGGEVELKPRDGGGTIAELTLLEGL